MRYFFCVICPPLAVLSVGRPISMILNIFLTMLGWIPGMIHAFFLVNDYRNEKRFQNFQKSKRI